MYKIDIFTLLSKTFTRDIVAPMIVDKVEPVAEGVAHGGRSASKTCLGIGQLGKSAFAFSISSPTPSEFAQKSDQHSPLTRCTPVDPASFNI